jgi:uncharacterized membrane protein
MRLQEAHAALIHLPLALLPLGVATDLLARVTDDEELATLGRAAALLGGAGAVAAAVSGLVAQTETEAQDEAHDVLVTHRSLEMAALLASGTLALARVRRRRPSWLELALGAGASGIMIWGGLLGGELVYEHGVGVVKAGQTPPPHVHELGPVTLVRRLGRDLVHAVRHALEHAAEGKILPALRR